jgi:hypothetical protein
MNSRNTILLFASLIVLSLVVLALSKDKQITSIYSLEKYENPNPEIKTERIANVLYSGDIIDVSDGSGKFMNRHDYNSEILMTKPEEKGVNTNLSKLRIVSVNHNDKSLQMPVRFNDTVYIAHNAYIENKNSVRFVKYGEKLQSHQSGEMFKTYKIINPGKADDNSFVSYGIPILLRRADTSDLSYLTIDKNDTITTKNPMDKASKFTLNLRRVYEAYEKNLCICLDEVLYP